MHLRRVVREVHVQDDRHARRRLVLQDRVIEEAVRVRDAATRRAARRLVRLRQIEVLVAQRSQNVIGKRGRAGIGRTFSRRVGRLRDVESGRILVEVLHVADLAAAVDRDRRRQPRVEELTLVVAEDDHGIGRDLVELLAERLERGAALHEALTPLLHRDLVRKAGRTRLQQRLVVVGLPAEPVILVLAVGLRAQVPLLRRRREQRPVRRSDP